MELKGRRIKVREEYLSHSEFLFVSPPGILTIKAVVECELKNKNNVLHSCSVCPGYLLFMGDPQNKKHCMGHGGELIYEFLPENAVDVITEKTFKTGRFLRIKRIEESW
jgi:hypothetical protein